MVEWLARGRDRLARGAGRIAGGLGCLGQQLWFGAACSAAALAARWAVDPWLGDRHEFLPGYLAIVAATWVASWRGGATAAALFLAANAMLFAPRSPVDAGMMHEVLAYLAFICVGGLLLALTDFAARAHRSLRDRVRDLDAADHRKTDFMAMVAHELRNPLSMLSTGTQLIRQGRLEQHALSDVWQALERQTAHMKRLVGDLMDTARAEQGKLSLVRETVAIATVVAQARADAQGLAQNRRQIITVALPDDAPRLEVDPHRIQQVLDNLLHNASKFSPEGAVIDMRVESSPTEVSIVVSDPGRGIEASHLQGIFDSFVQVEPGSGRTQGLGLGLALCRKLVEMHGGSIEAHSEGPGRGSQFRVRLPRTPAPTARTTPLSAAQPFATSKEPATAAPARPRLLVVDDNVDCADALATLLRLEGYEAQVAYDGHSALEAAAAEPPLVVFVDMCLPDMTGSELVTGLRKALDPAKAAFIGLSGIEPDGVGAPPGFSGYLVKPVGMEEIRHALASVAGEPSCLH